MNDNVPFPRPVIIAEPRGHIQIVRSARDAAHCVMGNWPFLRTQRTLEAIRILIEAIEGRIPAEDARRAFVEAAEESGLLVELRGEMGQKLH